MHTEKATEHDDDDDEIIDRLVRYVDIDKKR